MISTVEYVTGLSEPLTTGLVSVDCGARSISFSTGIVFIERVKIPLTKIQRVRVELGDKRKGNVLGGAALGGLVLGPIGAIVGALSENDVNESCFWIFEYEDDQRVVQLAVFKTAAKHYKALQKSTTEVLAKRADALKREAKSPEVPAKSSSAPKRETESPQEITPADASLKRSRPQKKRKSGPEPEGSWVFGIIGLVLLGLIAYGVVRGCQAGCAAVKSIFSQSRKAPATKAVAAPTKGFSAAGSFFDTIRSRAQSSGCR